MKWMQRSCQVIVCLIILLAACSRTLEKVEILEAWARPADSGANSAAYFVIGGGTQDDFLISASSQIAEKTEIHRSIIDAEGKAHMEQQDRVEILGGEKISFAPGGYHVMLINLHQPLEVGDSFILKLNFEKSGEVTIDVSVQTP